MVQEEIKRRKDFKDNNPNNQERFSSKYAFSKKIVCGCCVQFYRRHYHIYKGEKINTWVCSGHKTKGEDFYKQKYITEYELKKSFLIIIKELIEDYEELKQTIKNNVFETKMNKNEDELVEIIDNINKLQKNMLEIYKKKNQGIITQEQYLVEGNNISAELEVLNERKEKLESESSINLLNRNRTEELISILENDTTNEFKEEILRKLVNRVVITNRTTLEYEFKIGIKKKIAM